MSASCAEKNRERSFLCMCFRQSSLARTFYNSSVEEDKVVFILVSVVLNVYTARTGGDFNLRRSRFCQMPRVMDANDSAPAARPFCFIYLGWARSFENVMWLTEAGYFRKCFWILNSDYDLKEVSLMFSWDRISQFSKIMVQMMGGSYYSKMISINKVFS